MAATMAQVAAVMAGMAIVATVYMMDVLVLTNWSLKKFVAFAGGFAIAAVVLIAVARQLG
jgi:hypothetical protein